MADHVKIRIYCGNTSEQSGSSNEPYPNPHDVQNIPDDLDIQEKGKNKVSPKVKDRKRKKGAEIFGQHLNRICDVLESRTTTTKNNSDKPGCSIEEVMRIAGELADKENDIEIFMIATEVLLTRSHREMFVIINDPELQIEWLKRMGNMNNRDSTSEDDKSDNDYSGEEEKRMI
ncbi:hypothetical protein CJ030_MR8G026860 [Morella rubra]|uniref:Uncharacterized protein n=1 Tax=Morella rubra TaxID=262757 RepID=A0A6A1UT09_9ROSI|nr:hypothetical protein CJ030_MR8G026860 [Morella rubra]